MRSRGWSGSSSLLGVTTLGLVLAVTWASGCSSAEKEGEGRSVGPAGASGGGPGGVSISVAAQDGAGIATRPLSAIARQPELPAYGTVLELDSLSALRVRYTSAVARFEKAKASLEYSKQQYERTKVLYGEAQSVSDKALQAAQAAWKSDEIEAGAAEEALSLLRDEAARDWGDAIAGWISGAAGPLQGLLRQESLLIRISLSPDGPVPTPPDTASALTSSGAMVPIRFVSFSPRTDPRIQGTTLLYLAGGGRPDLQPGMNVEAYLPMGPPVEGFVIPDSAVVWRRGSGWVYVQDDSVHFSRRELSTDQPVAGGYFVTKGFRPGERIVVNGAQLALSQELRSEIQGDEGD